jgi:hypothetical protein
VTTFNGPILKPTPPLLLLLLLLLLYLATREVRLEPVAELPMAMIPVPTTYTIGPLGMVEGKEHRNGKKASDATERYATFENGREVSKRYMVSHASKKGLLGTFEDGGGRVRVVVLFRGLGRKNDEHAERGDQRSHHTAAVLSQLSQQLGVNLDVDEDAQAANARGHKTVFYYRTTRAIYIY